MSQTSREKQHSPNLAQVLQDVGVLDAAALLHGRVPANPQKFTLGRIFGSKICDLECEIFILRTKLDDFATFWKITKFENFTGGYHMDSSRSASTACASRTCKPKKNCFEENFWWGSWRFWLRNLIFGYEFERLYKICKNAKIWKFWQLFKIVNPTNSSKWNRKPYEFVKIQNWILNPTNWSFWNRKPYEKIVFLTLNPNFGILNPKP